MRGASVCSLARSLTHSVTRTTSLCLLQRASRQTTVTVKATAGNWSPGSKAPAHLAGKNLPGNFGFDPLSLGAPEGALSYYQQAELQHCRWAMMGVAGILIPDVLTHAGVLNVPDWTQAGKIYIEKEGAYSFASLLMVQLFLHNFVELKRWEDIKKPGSQGEPGSFLGFEASFTSKDTGYPGGLFDPLNLSKGNLDDLKLKEIKNGRLAMVAFLGFAAGHAATGLSPVDALLKHLENPWGENFCSNGVSLPISIF